MNNQTNINDLERDLLQIILNNEPLLNAIRKVFEKTIENIQPNVVETDNDEMLGQKFRAYETAVNIIRQGFDDLMSYKINKNPPKVFNKER